MVIKHIKISLLILLSLLFGLLACEGDQGLQGPKGPQGDDGIGGELSAPEDRVFALAIFNGTKKDHNGANKLTLTFDQSAVPSGSVVVANEISTPPVIDGIDDGSSVWGAHSSNIDVTQQAFGNNYIEDVYFKAAYDNNNIYFLVSWDEVSEGEFTVSNNQRHLDWSYVLLDDGFTYDFVPNEIYEDRVALMFAVDRTFYWNSQGCLAGCHVGDGDPDYMRTLASFILFDTWQWGSATSNQLGVAFDRVLTSLAFEGFQYDIGYAPIYQNLEVDVQITDEGTIFDSLPIYMHYKHRNNPDYVANDPVWEYYTERFDDELEWTSSSQLPGWIAREPSNEADLIKCKGVYSNGTWTVEFSRPRDTGDKYDVVF